MIFDLSKKSILIDEYRRSWAQRYIREAKADLEEAERNPSVANDLKLEAMKKAQASVYFSLGSPEDIRKIIEYCISHKVQPKDPVLKYLLGFESDIQLTTDLLSLNGEDQEVSAMVRIASDIVALYTSED